MAWRQITVITDPTTAPDISDFFSDWGALSVTYADAEDEPVYEPALNQIQIWSRTQVIALFEDDVDCEPLKAALFLQFVGQPLQDWQEQIIEDQAWERAWMEHFKPMLFANRLWVCPTGQEQYTPNTVCMTLDPGLAFGTGTHPTTALCLEWLASQNLHGKIVIDYGCGSGILAVAALLLGAEVAHAVDIDPQALTATRYNAEKNQVAARVQTYLPEQFSSLPADIVLANILAKPLIELAPTLSQLVTRGGHLVLSGILNEQAESVTNAYQQQGLSVHPAASMEDWCRLQCDHLG